MTPEKLTKVAETSWTRLESGLLEHDNMMRRHDQPMGPQPEFPETPQRRNGNIDEGLGLPNLLFSFKQSIKRAQKT